MEALIEIGLAVAVSVQRCSKRPNCKSVSAFVASKPSASRGHGTLVFSGMDELDIILQLEKQNELYSSTMTTAWDCCEDFLKEPDNETIY